MADINIEGDLTSVNDQIVKLVDELNKVNAARENLIQQVQNLNGVAMYLRGKVQEVNPSAVSEPSLVDIPTGTEADLERTSEYPEETT